MYCHEHFICFEKECPVCDDNEEGVRKYYVYSAYNYYQGSNCKTIKLKGVYTDIGDAKKALDMELLHQIEYEDQFCWINDCPYVKTQDDMNEE